MQLPSLELYFFSSLPSFHIMRDGVVTPRDQGYVGYDLWLPIRKKIWWDKNQEDIANSQ